MQEAAEELLSANIIVASIAEVGAMQPLVHSSVHGLPAQVTVRIVAPTSVITPAQVVVQVRVATTVLGIARVPVKVIAAPLAKIHVAHLVKIHVAQDVTRIVQKPAVKCAQLTAANPLV